MLCLQMGVTINYEAIVVKLRLFIMTETSVYCFLKGGKRVIHKK